MSTEPAPTWPVAVTITDPRFFRWYPSLRTDWSGVLTARGPYHAGNPGDVLCANSAGETMAIRAEHLRTTTGAPIL